MNAIERSKKLDKFYVVFGGLENPPDSYLFFGSMGIMAMLVIFWYSWGWTKRNMTNLSLSSYF